MQRIIVQMVIKSLNNIKYLRVFTLVLFMILIVAGALRFKATENPIDYSLNALMPSLETRNADFKYFKDAISKEIVYLVVSDDQEKSRIIINSIEELINSFDKIKSDIHNDKKAYEKFYFYHRYVYAKNPYICDNCEKTPENIAAFKDSIYSALYNPFGGYSSYEIEHDPFMAMRSIIQEDTRRMNFTDDGIPYLKFDELNVYILRAVIQKTLSSDELNKLYDESFLIKNSYEKDNVKVFFNGEAFYTHYAQASSQTDMTRIGMISTVVLIVLLLFVYRGLLVILSTLTVLTLSLLSGISAVFIIYGSIHAMTLAMGMCLIGICVDYCIHVFTSLKPISDAKMVRKKLFKPLIFSLITSILAYLVLSFTDLIVLSELSLLAIVALIMTFLLVYGFLTNLSINTSPNVSIAKFIIKIFTNLPKVLTTTISLIIFFSGTIGIYFIHSDDDVSHMQETNKELLDMSEITKLFINGYQRGAYYVVKGQDINNALNNCHLLESRILISDLKDVILPCSFIPSFEVQQKRIENFAKMYPALEEVFTENSIPIEEEALPKVNNLFTYKDFPKDITGLFAKNSLLIQVNADNQTLKEILESDVNVEKMDLREFWTQVFTTYNTKLQLALIIAFALASLLMIPIFKTKIVYHFLIPILSGGAIGFFACMLFASEYFNLFTTLAFFMLLGLGADYCIFMYFLSHRNALDFVQSIVISSITTLASFGALAFSKTAVMASFGTVIGFGIFGICFFAMILKLSLYKEKFNDLS